MKDAVIRTLSGLVYIGIIVGLAFVPVVWSALVFLLLCMMAAGEFGALFWKRSNGRTEIVVYLSAALFAALVAPIVLKLSLWVALLLPLTVGAIVLLVVLQKSSNIRSVLAGSALGAPLLGICFATLTHLRHASIEVFLGLFIILWAADTMAYVWGRLIGGKKLLPRISPGKTISGFVGGIVSAMGFALIVAQFATELSTYQWVLSALVIGLFSTIGDLIESALKRHRGVKDSGNIMPGHGGILDRFDGMLLAAPAYFILLKAFAVI